jgi:hypothetical protein
LASVTPETALSSGERDRKTRPAALVSSRRSRLNEKLT